MLIEPRNRKFLLCRHWACCAVVMLLCFGSAAVAQQDAAPSPAPTHWTRPTHQHDPDEFHFAIVSDRAANPRVGVFEAALGKLQLLRPTFVLSIGDFIHGYADPGKPLTDEDVIRDKRSHIDQALDKLTMPFYRVAGNHDYNNDLSARIWAELYGPSYYAFEHKGVLFLCLNSQDGTNYRAGIGPQQIAWVKDELAKRPKTRWICLFFHQPLWLEDEKRLEAAAEGETPRLTGFNEIEALLEGRDYSVFAGHHHRYGKWVKDGQKYFRLATTGGQSSLSGPESGQFDHVMWVTMASDGPVFCNLLLEGILDEDAHDNLPVATEAKE